MTKFATVKELIPDPGPDRFWSVEFDGKYRKTPIRIELREYINDTSSMSKAIGKEYTIANPQSVADTATEILARVANYGAVVGEFYKLRTKGAANV